MVNVANEGLSYLSADELKEVVRDVLIQSLNDIEKMTMFLAAVRRALSGIGMNLVALFAVNGTIIKGSFEEITPVEFAQVVRYLKINGGVGLQEVLALFETYYSGEISEYVSFLQKKSKKKFR